MEAEKGGVQPHTQEAWETTEAGRGRQESPLEALEGAHPANTCLKISSFHTVRG